MTNIKTNDIVTVIGSTRRADNGQQVTVVDVSKDGKSVTVRFRTGRTWGTTRDSVAAAGEPTDLQPWAAGYRRPRG